MPHSLTVSPASDAPEAAARLTAATAGPTHFIGIGGIGMSGLAHLLLARGEAVTGSDLRESATLTDLREAGAEVRVGHSAEQVAGAGRVIYSAAVPEDNPELAAARRLGLPVCSRAELLAEASAGSQQIAIAGTTGRRPPRP